MFGARGIVYSDASVPHFLIMESNGSSHNMQRVQNVEGKLRHARMIRWRSLNAVRAVKP